MSEENEITDEFTLRRIKKMVDDLCIDLNGDIPKQLADKFCNDEESNPDPSHR